MPADRNSSRLLLRSVAVASALACTAVVSAVLPGAVASADELAGTTVVGELVQVWAESEHEDAADDSEGPLSFVETASGDAVRVPTEDVEDLPAGATVSVTVGAKVDDEAAGEHGVEAARTVLASNLLAAPAEPAAAATSNRSLTNEVTVVLVTPAGAPKDGTSLAEVVDLVDGPVADFWSEQSNGAISLGVTAAHDWTPTTAGCADPTELWDEAAAAVRFDAGAPGDGKHLLLYVTDAAPDCAYALAQVGSAPTSGGRLYVRDTDASVIAHELGHNFGLGHSSGRQCDAAVEAGNCRTAAYRDLYDVMGVSWGRLGSLNAPQAARLGVLTGADVQALTVQSAGTTLTLAPVAGRAGIRAVRLTDAEGVDYWLEYRTPTARDAWLGTGNAYGLDTGVLLRQAGTTLPDTSLLLDGTPSAAAGWNADLQTALPVGVAVPVSRGDFSVLVKGTSGSGALLEIVPVTAPSGDGPDLAGPLPQGVMSAQAAVVDEGDAPVATPSPVMAAEVPKDVLATQQLASATATGGSGPLFPVVGVLLFGSLLGVVCLTRRPRARLR